MITLPLPGIQAVEQKPKRTPVSPDVRKLYPQQKEAFFGLTGFYTPGLQGPGKDYLLFNRVK